MHLLVNINSFRNAGKEARLERKRARSPDFSLRLWANSSPAKHPYYLTLQIQKEQKNWVTLHWLRVYIPFICFVVDDSCLAWCRDLEFRSRDFILIQRLVFGCFLVQSILQHIKMHMFLDSRLCPENNTSIEQVKLKEMPKWALQLFRSEWIVLRNFFLGSKKSLLALY